MKNLIILTCCLFSGFIFSQEKKEIFVKYIQEEIKPDGILDEKAWSLANEVEDFYQYFPSDKIKAKQQTYIKMLFDDNFLYVAVKAMAKNGNYITPSLRRDFRAGGSDNITLMFDTFNDATNAFIFGSNPYGVKREILLSGGGNDIRNFNGAWDSKWFLGSKKTDNYYILEFKIPFSSFRYKSGETKWRFNTYKFDSQENEQTTWIQIPQNQFIFNLAYMGTMVFEKPLPASRTPVSLIPYVNALTGNNFENSTSKSDFKVGGDAKLTLGNSLNLDLTFNPDFSQVEVDRQVTNLTRFEVSLPERRQFFIENSDLFSDYGNNSEANPFFTRRIGIATDKNGNTIQNNILAGARLSGKINNNLRVGLLNIQTDEDIANEIPTVNHTAISLQQKVFSRSNISFLFLNKQNTKSYDFVNEEDKFNRVIGVDYNLASSDNTWTGKYFVHKSFSPINKKNDFSAGATTTYKSRKYEFSLRTLYVGANFNSDLGFIRRNDILRINPFFKRNFWPSKGKFQRHNLTLATRFIWRPEQNFQNSDYTFFSRWQSTFKNTSDFNIRLFNRYTFLYGDFNPSGDSNAIPIPGNKGYNYTTLGVSYQSDKRKQASFTVGQQYGGFFNGSRYSFNTSINYRLQPYFTTSLQINYDYINLPNPHSDASIWLIGPRFDVTFSRSLFWATFLQYSNQRDNFSINTRLQWRFAPLSDLFIVYNDNYFTEDFGPKNRSINLKLTYWLNI